MRFKYIFLAIFLGFLLLVAAFFFNRARPRIESDQPSADFVKATGKCAECHSRETAAIVQEFGRSQHARKGVTCLDCHTPQEGQEAFDHRGFRLSKKLTAKNCSSCHRTEYEQFARSRHAGPAWAAVDGIKGFSEEQIAQGERWHPGWIKRPSNPLTSLEGSAATVRGCQSCHAIGRPNPDGTFGTCTDCHARHAASVALAREPRTCGQCHMGPDHSQVEIYEESKHGALFHSQRDSFHLNAAPKLLTTRDMPVPTCATCHLSGLDGLKVTHDPSERLSWYLFAPVSEKRPGYDRAQGEMKLVCSRCHSGTTIDRYYEGAESVVKDTNEKVSALIGITARLRKDGFLKGKQFDDPADFLEFDLWHYYGRTSKHGAFMGGADFVQWHGNFELLRHKVELEDLDRRLRGAGKATPAPSASPQK